MELDSQKERRSIFMKTSMDRNGIIIVGKPHCFYHIAVAIN